MASTWGTSWGTSWATSWDRGFVPPTPTLPPTGGGRPWSESPHKGWNKKQWLKLKKHEDELEDTLSKVWNELTGVTAPIEVQAEVVKVLKPVKYEYKPEWKTVDLEIVNKLISIYNEQIARRKRLLQDDEDILHFL